MVDLNRAVAIGLAEGPEAGLAAIDALDASALRAYHHLPAARADFLRRLGRWPEAAREYRLALGLAENALEKRFLAARIARCEACGDPWTARRGPTSPASEVVTSSLPILRRGLIRPARRLWRFPDGGCD